MKKIDELIAKFKEFKEELNKGSPRVVPDGVNTRPAGQPMPALNASELGKNVNMSYSPAPNMVKQDPMLDSVAMSEKSGAKGVVSPNDLVPGGKMAGQPKDAKKAEGETKHDRCAREVGAKGNVDNPHAVCVAAGVKPDKWKKSSQEKISLSKNGQWYLDKCATNEEANPSGNHNKEKFMVMPMVEDRSSKKEEVKGKPYISKGEIKSHPANEPCDMCGKSPCKCEEQRDQNKGKSAVGP